MALSDMAVRNAKPQNKPYKIYDEHGLYLLVQPSGKKHWRWRYRFNNKEGLETLGSVSVVSLKEARQKRDTFRNVLAQGINPKNHRKELQLQRQQVLNTTFEGIAKEWFKVKASEVQQETVDAALRRSERYLFPFLGSMPITAITTPVLYQTLRRIEDQGALETAQRVLRICKEVFAFAIRTGRAESNPAIHISGALKKPKTKHFAAVTTPDDLTKVLKAIDTYQGLGTTTKYALQLLPLVFVRPSMLQKAEWKEIDIQNALWEIPKEKMKMSIPHVVPLARQTLAILNEAHRYTGTGQYVFPNMRSNKRPMSEVTLLNALRSLGFSKDQITAHGFRATARTILAEVLNEPSELIEHQLAHRVRDPNGRAYNRTSFIPERRKMMQKWADYLEKLAKQPTKGA